MFGSIPQYDANLVNGYVVFDLHTHEVIYEVERKYWDQSDIECFNDLAKSNINCQFVPLHVWNEKEWTPKMARFAILED